MDYNQEIVTKNPRETQKLGRKIGITLKGGEVLAITGNLGAGKTTFVQGLAVGLGVMDRIISPTFLLMREHLLASNGKLYHIDLYRLEENVEQEVESMGIKDIWNNKENIVVIEWAEKIDKMLPENTIFIKIENLDYETRKIAIKSQH